MLPECNIRYLLHSLISLDPGFSISLAPLRWDISPFQSLEVTASCSRDNTRNHSWGYPCEKLDSDIRSSFESRNICSKWCSPTQALMTSLPPDSRAWPCLCTPPYINFAVACSNSRLIHSFFGHNRHIVFEKCHWSHPLSHPIQTFQHFVFEISDLHNSTNTELPKQPFVTSAIQH